MATYDPDRDAGATDDAPISNASVRDVDLKPWQRTEDGSEIRSPFSDLRLCAKCNRAIPLDAKRCPHCAGFAGMPGPGAPRRTVRPVDVDKLHDAAVADYCPTTFAAKQGCEILARLYAAEKLQQPGDATHQRIVGAIGTLTASLEASRSSETSATRFTVTRLIVDPETDTLDRDMAIAEIDRISARLDKLRASLPFAAEVLDATAEVEPETTTPSDACPYCHRNKKPRTV
jgi:RNA polymerase subunit RPABC4/transcription elongation factor Spt4